MSDIALSNVRARSYKEFCEHWRISDTTRWREVKSGRLKITKIRGRAVITPEDEAAWLALLGKAA